MCFSATHKKFSLAITREQLLIARANREGGDGGGCVNTFRPPQDIRETVIVGRHGLNMGNLMILSRIRRGVHEMMMQSFANRKRFVTRLDLKSGAGRHMPRVRR